MYIHLHPCCHPVVLRHPCPAQTQDLPCSVHHHCLRRNTQGEHRDKYAKLCLESEGKQSTWSSTEEDIRAYLGFYILMRFNHKPEVRDNWSRDEFLHYAPIASRIARDRFEEISRYLHFVSNDTLPKRDEPGYHRLQKVMPVLTHLKQKFLAAYNPHQQNAIDEAMIPFKGTGGASV